MNGNAFQIDNLNSDYILACSYASNVPLGLSYFMSQAGGL
jgi:hypothetical protein